MVDAPDNLSASLLGAFLTNPDGSVRSPICCQKDMLWEGECSGGCCDYYVCVVCAKRVTVEWPD